MIFEIPEKFQLGIAAGILKRFNAIIKDTRTGQIVGHVREVIPAEELINVNNGIGKLAANIAALQNAQIFMAAGLGIVAIIAIVGFVYVGHKLNKIQDQLKTLSETVDKIHEQTKLIRHENLISLTKNYYRAIAAFRDNLYEKAYNQASDCAADIENYIRNMPVNEIIGDEERLKFMVNFIFASMGCQLASANQLQKYNITSIYDRYKNLLLLLENMFEGKKNECRTLLPTSPEDIKFLKLFSQQDSWANKILSALSASQVELDNAHAFLELGNDQIYQGQIDGQDCMLVLEPQYNNTYV